MIRTLLTIGMLCVAQIAWAQTPVIITQGNTRFNAAGDNPSWRNVESGSLEIPARGENMTWDYSNESDAAGGYEVEYIEADHPDFPTATVAYNSFYALNQFQLTGQAFFEARESGEYYIGNLYNEATFNLGFGTLFVPEQTNQNPDPPTDLRLPATIGTTWETESVLPIDSRLTVASAGLDNALLTYVQRRSYRDSIVGWGTVKLPGGMSFDALLKKQVTTRLDSFYLNGQPAPQQLLTFLGVEQGSTASGELYAFYTPGVSTEIMLFIVYQDGMEVTYRDDLSASGVEEQMASAVPARLYPNPVTGDDASLEFEKSSGGAWSIGITDMLGRMVQTMQVNDPVGIVDSRLDLPSSLANGFYYYEIRDEHGARKANGKIVVERK